MFARVKETGQYQYPQTVQNRREGKKRFSEWSQRWDELKSSNKSVISKVWYVPSPDFRDCLDDPLRKKHCSGTDKLDWSGLDLRTPVAGSEDRKDHWPSSGGPQVRVRCRTGDLSDGSAQALCLGIGPLL